MTNQWAVPHTVTVKSHNRLVEWFLDMFGWRWGYKSQAALANDAYRLLNRVEAVGETPESISAMAAEHGMTPDLILMFLEDNQRVNDGN